MVKTLNLALALLLELCMLVAYCYWGFNAGDGWLAGTLLGIGTPAAAVILWGVFAAPNSSRRLHEPWLLCFKVMLFGLAAVALSAAGQTTLAAMFIVGSLVQLSLAHVWKQ
jgi:hypothetical protein